MSETAVKTFITTSLDMGIGPDTIKKVLEALHKDDDIIAIDGDLYHWGMTELEKQYKIRNPDSKFPLEQSISQPLNEVNFDKEIVQTSLVACHLLDNSDSVGEDLAHPHSLVEINHSKFLSIETSHIKSSQCKEEFLESYITSSSESPVSSDYQLEMRANGSSEVAEQTSRIEANDGAVHQYLIAKGACKLNRHTVYYLAFGSHPNLRQWSENYTSFHEGEQL